LVKPNILDKFISFISPTAGVKRLKAKAALSYYTSYDGASTQKKSLKNWFGSLKSADRDDLPALNLLRARSRDLYRNDPLVTGAIETNIDSIVGAGLRVQAQIDYEYLGISEDEAIEWEKKAERFFNFWARSVNASADRQKNFYELQAIALASALLSGDVFAILPAIKRDFWRFETTVSLIEADRVCNENNFTDSDELAGGIRVNEWGEPIEYHILKSHPGGYDFAQEWVKIPAWGKSGRRNVIHLFKQVRPGQRRGVPYLAPVIKHLKLLGDYTEAELTAALINGLFTVFLKSESADSAFDDDNELKLAPGAIIGLAADESIEVADPKRPNSAFDAFVRGIIEQIGVGLNIPYEILMKHFTSSYTAARASFLEAWRAFKTRRAWFVNGFCQPIYELVITEAVLKGYLEAPGFLEDPFVRMAYLKTTWYGPTPGQINEKVETDAAAKRVQEGFSTREKEAAEMNGTDFFENVRKAKRENEALLNSGLKEIQTSKEIK